MLSPPLRLLFPIMGMKQSNGSKQIKSTKYFDVFEQFACIFKLLPLGARGGGGGGGGG